MATFAVESSKLHCPESLHCTVLHLAFEFQVHPCVSVISSRISPISWLWFCTIQFPACLFTNCGRFAHCLPTVCSAHIYTVLFIFHIEYGIRIMALSWLCRVSEDADDEEENMLHGMQCSFCMVRYPLSISSRFFLLLLGRHLVFGYIYPLCSVWTSCSLSAVWSIVVVVAAAANKLFHRLLGQS